MSFDAEMDKLRGLGKHRRGGAHGDGADSDDGPKVGDLVSLRNDEIYSDDQPRVTFKEIESLAELIREQGQQQPVRVNPRDDKGYRLEIGERRWRACKYLGTDVLAIITEPKKVVDRILVQLAENIGRKDLDPIEEAVAFKRLRDELGFSVAEIGRRVGYSKAVVSKRIALTDLPEALESIVMEQKLLDIEIIGLLRRAASDAPAAYEHFCKAIANDEEVRRADVKAAIEKEKAGRSEDRRPGLKIAESVTERDPGSVAIHVRVTDGNEGVQGTVRLDLAAQEKEHVVVEGEDGELYEAPLKSVSLDSIR